MTDPGIPVFLPPYVRIRCRRCGAEEVINSRGISIDHPRDETGAFVGTCPSCRSDREGKDQ